MVVLTPRDVTCEYCHAEAGSACKTSGGMVRTRFHYSRVEAFKNAPISIEEAVARDEWQQQKDGFLFGIQFARNAMRMSQDEIDERLAEMWADQVRPRPV